MNATDMYRHGHECFHLINQPLFMPDPIYVAG